MLSREVIVKKAFHPEIQWPEECAICGKVATTKFPLMTGVLVWHDRYKSEGVIAPVPYCGECQKKNHRYEKLIKVMKNITYVLWGVISFPIMLLLLISLSEFNILERFALSLGVGVFAALAITIIPLWVPFYLISIFSNLFSKPISAKDHEKDGVKINFSRGEYAIKFIGLNKHILLEQLDEQDIQAELEQVNNIESEEFCWFCSQQKLADGLPGKLELTKSGESNQILLIPRCDDCITKYQGVGCGLSSLIALFIIGGGIIFSLLTNEALGFWSWVIGIPLSIALAVLLVGLFYKNDSQKKQKMYNRALEYPKVKKMMEQGWEIKSESQEEN